MLQKRRATGCRDTNLDVVGTVPSADDLFLKDASPTSTPDTLDLSHLVKRIKDQGVFGTCAGFATATAAENCIKMRHDPEFEKEISALHVYKQARAIRREQNDPLDGTTLDATLYGLKRGGYLFEDEYPYKPTNRFGTFKLHEGIKGIKRCGLEFARITDMSRAESEVKTGLAAGYGVVGGWLVGAPFENWRPTDPPFDSIQGTGHAMVIHDFPNGHPRLLNSWGKDKGDGGFWTVTWNFVRKARSLWLVKFVPLP